VQGVGYPNPDRSHFQSMDIWQTADPAHKVGSGWLGRGLDAVRVRPGQIPAIHVGAQQPPLALRGSAAAVPTIHPTRPYPRPPRPTALARARQPPPNSGSAAPAARAGGGGAGPPPDKTRAARRALIEALARLAPAGDDVRGFVRRTSLQTYATIEELRKAT